MLLFNKLFNKALSNIVTIETIGQTLILVLGALLLFFEEKLPSFEMPVKRYRITFGQIRELLMVLSILWVLNLISLINEVFPWQYMKFRRRAEFSALLRCYRTRTTASMRFAIAHSNPYGLRIPAERYTNNKLTKPLEINLLLKINLLYEGIIY